MWNLKINFQFIKVCLIARYHKVLKNLYAKWTFVYAWILEMFIINYAGWYLKIFTVNPLFNPHKIKEILVIKNFYLFFNIFYIMI